MVVTIGRKRRIVPSRKSARYVIRSMSDTRKMFQYLRAARRERVSWSEWSAGGGLMRSPFSTTGTGYPASTGFMVGLMTGVPLFENACNQMVERRVLHADVDDRIP